MDTQILDRFKDYIYHNYNNPDLSISMICSNIHCSRDTLRRAVLRKYGYSTMRYVEYFRILRAMRLITINGTKKNYHYVGYNSDVVFSRTFLRVTGFNTSCFYTDDSTKYKSIIPVIYDIATKDPKKAIEFITKSSSTRSILLNKQEQKFNVIKKPLITLKERDENYFYKHVL